MPMHYFATATRCCDFWMRSLTDFNFRFRNFRTLREAPCESLSSCQSRKFFFDALLVLSGAIWGYECHVFTHSCYWQKFLVQANVSCLPACAATITLAKELQSPNVVEQKSSEADKPPAQKGSRCKSLSQSRQLECLNSFSSSLSQATTTSPANSDGAAPSVDDFFNFQALPKKYTGQHIHVSKEWVTSLLSSHVLDACVTCTYIYTNTFAHSTSLLSSHVLDACVTCTYYIHTNFRAFK